MSRTALLLIALTVAAGCAPNAPGVDSFGDTDRPESFCTVDTADDAACDNERLVAEHFETLLEDPEALRALLVSMPKGADLHSHLSGAVQTERLIEWAIDDELCVKENTLKLASCSSSSVPVGDVEPQALLEAWSMEGFEGDVQEGHDHFFATFGRFGRVTKNHTADMIAAVRSNAAEHNEQYLELMLALGTSPASWIGRPIIEDLVADWDGDSLREARERLLADEEFQENVSAAATDLTDYIDDSDAILGCAGDQPDPGCSVEVRYLVQVWRASNREAVLAQMVHAYELGAREPRVVGLNLAAAEDHADALAGYNDAMKALGVLREDTPAFHVALHAGELVESLLPEEQHQHLGFHIREAVLTAGADRIGHGIDILSEDSDELSSEQLREAMRERGVAVELCLSSNEFILGVGGEQHPMAAYLESGVPLTVATDDEGVSRSSLSDELLLAVSSQKLSYRQTKAMLRNSLIHSFLPGERLLDIDGGSARLSDGCSSYEACQQLTADSEHARMQYRLESALSAFEARLASELE